MNPLEPFPKVRKVLYNIWGLIGLGLGAGQVGISAADVSQPKAFTVTLAVFAFLTAGFGFTAGQNTTTSPPDSTPPYPPQP